MRSGWLCTGTGLLGSADFDWAKRGVRRWCHAGRRGRRNRRHSPVQCNAAIACACPWDRRCCAGGAAANGGGSFRRGPPPPPLGGKRGFGGREDAGGGEEGEGWGRRTI